MNFKTTCVTFVLLLFACYSSFAQKRISISAKELKSLIGCWNGTFNYSGTRIRKPHTASGEVAVKALNASNKFEFVNTFSSADGDHSCDTITISKNGRRINNETIRSKRLKNGKLIVTTEGTGVESDNTAVATRHTYIISNEGCNRKKEVRPEGETEWLEREEYQYTRKLCNGR